MGSKAFNKIAEGLSEVLAIARGEAKPASLYIPAEIDVKSIRSKLDLSQDEFAALFGFTVNQIKDWEQGRSRPLGGVRAYLTIIDRDPTSVLGLLRRLPLPAALGHRQASAGHKGPRATGRGMG
jgi:putative transcriptional regulator